MLLPLPLFARGGVSAYSSHVSSASNRTAPITHGTLHLPGRDRLPSTTFKDMCADWITGSHRDLLDWIQHLSRGPPYHEPASMGDFAGPPWCAAAHGPVVVVSCVAQCSAVIQAGFSAVATTSHKHEALASSIIGEFVGDLGRWYFWYSGVWHA